WQHLCNNEGHRRLGDEEQRSEVNKLSPRDEIDVLHNSIRLSKVSHGEEQDSKVLEQRHSKLFNDLVKKEEM
ncbi:hypothetical protein PMAYCL1PPCAC_01516, partial [Pristionchus mayeri]